MTAAVGQLVNAKSETIWIPGPHLYLQICVNGVYIVHDGTPRFENVIYNVKYKISTDRIANWIPITLMVSYEFETTTLWVFSPLKHKRIWDYISVWMSDHEYGHSTRIIRETWRSWVKYCSILSVARWYPKANYKYKFHFSISNSQTHRHGHRLLELLG